MPGNNYVPLVSNLLFANVSKVSREEDEEEDEEG
jgi:hypothetical protein